MRWTNKKIYIKSQILALCFFNASNFQSNSYKQNNEKL